MATIRPAVAAWQALLEGGADEDPETPVSAAEVLSLCQRTICILGNDSALISRSKILETVDPSWSKYGMDHPSKAAGTLFGDEFKSNP